MLVAGVTAVLTLGGLAFSQSAGKTMMHSCVFNWADLAVIPTKIGAVRRVCDNPTPGLANLEGHITTLNPGKSPHPPHRHADEELMIVKEGTLEVMQEGRTNIVTAGGIIFEASNELHGMHNIGTNQATYFVFRISPHDEAKHE